MDIEKRREALKKLLEARKIFYSLEMDDAEKEWDEQCRAYYEKYEKSIDDEESFEEYLGFSKRFEMDAPPPPEEYYEWRMYGTSVDQKEMYYDSMVESIVDNSIESTLEYMAKRISITKIGLSDMGLEGLFSGITDTKSPELRNNDAVCRLMEENAMVMLDVEVIAMLGEAYGKLGIPVEKLPEIGIQDTSFLGGYLSHFPKNEQNIIKEGAPEYGQYMNLYNLVEREQREQDLKNQKKEQDDLNGRTGKIAEAEALVDMQQGKQQE